MHPLDYLERTWLRWNRLLARSRRERCEEKARRLWEQAEQRATQYRFWIHRERFRGFDPSYDDTDLTWLYELLVYGGSVVLSVVLLVLLMLLKRGS